MNVETFKYDNRIVRAFAMATVVWAVVGMAAGLWVATELFWPAANLNSQFSTLGRLRPLHTNAVIFAFGCSPPPGGGSGFQDRRHPRYPRRRHP